MTHDPQYGRGLIEAVGYGGTPAEPFPDELLIPESDYEGIIKEQEERKTRLSDLITQAKLPPKNQRNLPYCWVFGPTGTIEASRVKQNQLMVPLSATSAGAVIKNFRAEGGWGREALQFLADRGVMAEEQWPECSLDRQYNTPSNWEIAKNNYRVTEWWELRPRNLRQLVSCVLRGIPVTVGYNWWQHQIYVADIIWLDGTIAIRIRNSWGPWGDNGFGIIKGSKMIPDDSCAPRVLIAA